MTFALGPFAQGLSSGIKNGMDIYEKWTDMSNRADAIKDMKAAQDADKAAKGGSTLDPSKGGALPGSTSAGTFGDQGDWTKKPAGEQPDISGMPPPWQERTGAGLSAFGNATSDAAGKNSYDSAGPKIAPTGAMKDPQYQPGVSTAPSNMKTYDTQPGQPGALDGPSPPSIGQQTGGPGPDLSHLTNRPVGAAIGDWIHGRHPGQPAQLIPTSPQGQAQGQALPTPPAPPQPAPQASMAPTLGKPSVGASILGAFGTPQYPGMTQ